MNHKERLVAVHQPNFFPWLGYFNKIARADVFVVLDTVQFPKGGGSWLNRVKVMVNAKPRWITVPVMRNYHGTKSIGHISIDERKPWRRKMLNTLMLNYTKARFFADSYAVISELLSMKETALASYNILVLRHLIELLQIDWGKVVFASDLDIAGARTDLLISIVRAVNGTAYLSGGGATGYQEDHKFAQAGLKLIYQNYQHPVYSQCNTSHFASGLSIVDVMMNCGFRQATLLITQAHTSP